MLFAHRKLREGARRAFETMREKFMEVYKANLIRLLFLILLLTSFGAKAKVSVFSVEEEKLGTQIKAFETFEGEKIEVKELKSKISTISSLLESDIIELKSGEIFYPEEVEYVFGMGESKFKSFSARAPGGHD